MEPASWSHVGEFVSKSQEAAACDSFSILEGREVTAYSVVWRSETERVARDHLLQHHYAGRLQEDIALATWFPASGSNRYTAVIDEVIVPSEDERVLKGNVQMTRDFLRRGRQLALSKGAGMAVMHNHLRPGWQGMSPDDIVMESRSVSNPARATGLPAVGLTLGTDGMWSARFWTRRGSSYERRWCSSVRIVSPEHLTVQTNPNLLDDDHAEYPKKRFRRSVEAWGRSGQELLSQLRVGIVGLGSVGALAAETMGRMGVRRLVLIDMDRVEEHNLDRLLHAGRWDIGRYKVHLAADNLERSASGLLRDLLVLPLSLRDRGAFRSLADCDVVLACADKPIARDLANHLALCHLVPVIEAGVALRGRGGSLHKGHIVSQIVTPDSRCLRCSGQYTTDQVSLELEGLLEDPDYIRTMPEERRPSRANVFPASMDAAAQQATLFTRLVLGAAWWRPVYQQRHHLSTGSLRTTTETCEPYCDVHNRMCQGSRGEPHWLLLDGDTSDS